MMTNDFAFLTVWFYLLKLFKNSWCETIKHPSPAEKKCWFIFGHWKEHHPEPPDLLKIAADMYEYMDYFF